MIEGENDLDSAEKALREAYRYLARECAPLSYRAMQADPETTIVHIMPKGRRVESGWFKIATWAAKSEAVIDALDSMDEGRLTPNRDEVFIAGEALAGTPREIVNLLFHQFVHQFSNQESSNTYHGNEFMQAASSLGVWEIERHPTQGWVGFDYGTLLDDVLRKVADSLDSKAFDLYRYPESTKVGSGKMRLWRCQCRKGASVYTGAILHAQCRKCGQPFRYDGKDKSDYRVQDRIWKAGEEIQT